MNFLAPSGTPIKFNTILKWLIRCFSARDPFESMRRKIKQQYNVKHCLFISSGRTALYLLLKCLFNIRNDNNRNQVIIPSYTCFSVPGSIEKAGLEVRVCDIDPHSLSYDIDKLSKFDFSKVLAIVTSNLYGIPNNLPEIEVISRENDVYLIDDAAQCLGGKINKRYSGTFGDAGLYSLDKGKNITSIQGGIIVTNNDEIAKNYQKIIESLPEQNTTSLTLDIVKLFVYILMLPPSRYWIITKIPFLGLGLTPYTTDYPVHKYSRVLAHLANLLFDELQIINQQRVDNANRILSQLPTHSDYKPVIPVLDSEPVFLRLPLLVKDKDKRDDLIDLLNKNGIGATASYPHCVLDITQIQDKLCDKKQGNIGREIAEQIVTIPTHPFTTLKHINKIVNTFKDVFDSGTPTH